MRPDVIVVGLGSMGAAAAQRLAERGVRVLGLDRFAPPHGRGAHAGGSRIIRMAYAEGADYVPLLRRAYELWSLLEEAAGQTLHTTTGGLMIGPADGTIVGGALASARAHGLAYELLDPAEVGRRFPAFTPAETEVALYEEVAGMVRPEAAIAAQLRLARRAGADLRYGVAVHGWRVVVGGGVAVATADGDLHAERLVIAPGAWAPELLAEVDVPLRVERRVQHYWRPPTDEYAAGRFPIWMWEYAPGLVAYGLPAAESDGRGDGAPGRSGGASGGAVGGGASGGAVGGGASDGGHGDAALGSGVKAALHHGGEPVDPGLGARDTTEAEVAAMRAWLANRLPGLAGAHWLGGKPCLYTLTPDEHFLLGLHPRYPQVAVAGGFSGHGFKFTPVVGEILADLAVSGHTAHPIGLFRPDRFAAHRSVP